MCRRLQQGALALALALALVVVLVVLVLVLWRSRRSCRPSAAD